MPRETGQCFLYAPKDGKISRPYLLTFSCLGFLLLKALKYHVFVKIHISSRPGPKSTLVMTSFSGRETKEQPRGVYTSHNVKQKKRSKQHASFMAFQWKFDILFLTRLSVSSFPCLDLFLCIV